MTVIPSSFIYIKKKILQAAVATKAQWDAMIVNDQTAVTILQHPDDNLCPIDTQAMQVVIGKVPHMNIVVVQAASRAANAILFGESKHSYQFVSYRLMKTFSDDIQTPEKYEIAINDKDAGHKTWTSIGLKCWACAGVMADVDRCLNHIIRKYLTLQKKGIGGDNSNKSDSANIRFTRAIRGAIEQLKAVNAFDHQISGATMRPMQVAEETHGLYIRRERRSIGTQEEYTTR